MLVILSVIRIKHHHLSISCILRRMARERGPHGAPVKSLCPRGSPAVGTGNGADSQEPRAPTPRQHSATRTKTRSLILFNCRRGVTVQFSFQGLLQLSTEKRPGRALQTVDHCWSTREEDGTAPASEPKPSELTSQVNRPNCVNPVRTRDTEGLLTCKVRLRLYTALGFCEK